MSQNSDTIMEVDSSWKEDFLPAVCDTSGTLLLKTSFQITMQPALKALILKITTGIKKCARNQ